MQLVKINSMQIMQMKPQLTFRMNLFVNGTTKIGKLVKFPEFILWNVKGNYA